MRARVYTVAAALLPLVATVYFALMVLPSSSASLGGRLLVAGWHLCGPLAWIFPLVAGPYVSVPLWAGYVVLLARSDARLWHAGLHLVLAATWCLAALPMVGLLIT